MYRLFARSHLIWTVTLDSCAPPARTTVGRADLSCPDQLASTSKIAVLPTRQKPFDMDVNVRGWCCTRSPALQSVRLACRHSCASVYARCHLPARPPPSVRRLSSAKKSHMCLNSWALFPNAINYKTGPKSKDSSACGCSEPFLNARR